ncbi:MAG: hypothetical protein ACQCN3_05705 [Candidatus Bathyarchaeia archaeon]
MSQVTAPKPKESELLKQLLGEWSVGVSLKLPNYKILTGYGKLSAKILDSNLGVTSQMDLYIDESEDYFEDAIWSFDRNSGKIHMFSLISQGDVHDHIGGWLDPQNLKVKWVGRHEGKPASEEIRLTWQSPDEIRIFEIEKLQNQPDVQIEYVAKRKKACK